MTPPTLKSTSESADSTPQQQTEPTRVNGKPSAEATQRRQPAVPAANGAAQSIMKKTIHPDYVNTTVKCGCGNSFTTRSTRPELKVDICNVCHPFYTGKLKFIDTAGRIEKFKTKFAGAGYASLKRGKKQAEPAATES